MLTSPSDTLTCPHFGVLWRSQQFKPLETGGFAPPPYDQQLRPPKTRGRLRGLHSPLLTLGEWRPFLPSPDIRRYRNKMEFAFGQGATAEEVLAGMRQAGRFDRVVDLQSHELVSHKCVDTLIRTREWTRTPLVLLRRIPSQTAYWRCALSRLAGRNEYRSTHGDPDWKCGIGQRAIEAQLPRLTGAAFNHFLTTVSGSV